MVEGLQRFRVFIRTITIVGTLALILLTLFEAIPLFQGSNQHLLSLASAQEWVVERVAKDVQMMQQAQLITEREQAVNELQNELPYWEANQKTLQQSMLPSDIQILFEASSSDFTDIDKAANVILSRPTTLADPIEVAIVLNHERPYFLNYTQIVAILRQRVLSITNDLFGIEVFFSLLFLGTGVWAWVRVERLVRHAEKQQSATLPTLPSSDVLSRSDPTA